MQYEYCCKFRAILRLRPPKQHTNLRFLECENVKQISKRAFCTGTVCSKFLK